MNRQNVLAGNTAEEYEALFSDFLMDSWSYSKVRAFARNEKAFEMSYIFNYKSRRSASNVAGNAYHTALYHYFTAIKNGETIPDIASMETIAFNYIDDVPADQWKLQKTAPTVIECIQKATKMTSGLLNNFLSEVGIYTDNLKDVVEIEKYIDQFVVVNGVDIPLPLHLKADLIINTKDGKRVIVDHKSKAKFTSEEEMAMSIGIQAITYTLGYEAETGDAVDEVWFIENKHSKNRDGSKQLQAFKVALDADTRKLYEALLYEPLRKMISAVNDPDYVYIINDNDNFVDMAELYDFWARTMMAEVDEFDVVETKKALIEKRLRKIRDASIATINPKVIKDFKKNASQFIKYDLSNKDMTAEEKIEHVLRTFAMQVQVAHKFEGYSSDTFLLEVGSGVKIKNIYSHKLDLANALDVNNIRLTEDLVMYQGKSYLGVEMAKRSEKTLAWDKSYLDGVKIPIGVDNYDNTIVWDLENHSTPHMLVCGATGSGKSVSLRSTIEYAIQAGVTQITIFDPKYEFNDMARGDINVVNDIEEIEVTMECLVEDMNRKVKERRSDLHLVVFDEFADALAAASYGKGLEDNLKRLLQKGRSSGFRVIAATQRASTKVITGDAKVNFPVQICFRVPKEIDSKVVLDVPGAEALAGRGDGLMRSPEYFNIVRFQGFFKA